MLFLFLIGDNTMTNCHKYQEPPCNLRHASVQHHIGTLLIICLNCPLNMSCPSDLAKLASFAIPPPYGQIVCIGAVTDCVTFLDSLVFQNSNPDIQDT